MTVHTGPSERSSPSEPHAQTARPPLFMFPLLCSRSSPGVVIGPPDSHQLELDPSICTALFFRTGGARSHVLCIDDGQSTARLHPHAHIAHLSPIGHYGRDPVEIGSSLSLSSVLPRLRRQSRTAYMAQPSAALLLPTLPIRRRTRSSWTIRLRPADTALPRAAQPAPT